MSDKKSDARVIEISNLRQPTHGTYNISFSMDKNGQPKADFIVHKSPGVNENGPFWEFIRSRRTEFENAARTDLLAEMNKGGIKLAPVKIEINPKVKVGGSTDVDVNIDAGKQVKIPNVGKVGVNGEIKSNIKTEGSVENKAKITTEVQFNDPKMREIFAKVEAKHDERIAKRCIEQAGAWDREGGARILSPLYTGTKDKKGQDLYEAVIYNVTKQDLNQYFGRDKNFGDVVKDGINKGGEKIKEGIRFFLGSESTQENSNGNIASIKTNNFEGTDLAKHAGQLDKKLDAIDLAGKPKADVVAAVLDSSAKANFDRTADISVASSTKNPDALIASQGNGPGVLRADPVLLSLVQPGTAHTVAGELVKNNSTQQQVASNTVDTVEQNATRSSRIA
jgi:hypothetical protein